MVPTHLENLENLRNEKINLQAWKSPGKKKKLNVLEKSWKFKKIHMKLELIIFGMISIPLKQLLPQTTVLENLNFDLEKSCKNRNEEVQEP